MGASGIKSVRLAITGDNLSAKAKLDEIDVKADALADKHPELKIGIDTAAAQAKLAILREDLREGLEPKIDTADAELKLAEVSSNIEILGDRANKALKLKADDTEARVKILRLQAQLAHLHEVASRPDLITIAGLAKAHAEIAKLSLELDKLDAKNVKPKVSLGTAFSRLGAGLAQAGTGALWGAGEAAVLGPLPVILGATAVGVSSLIGPLAAAGAGVGLFGLVAKEVFTKTEGALTKLTAAQAAYGKATTAKSRATALRDEQLAMKGLTGSQRQFATALTDSKNRWSDFINKASPGVIGVLGQGLSLLPRVLKLAYPILGPVESVLHRIIGEISKSLNGGGLQHFFEFVTKNAGPSLSKLTSIVGHVVSGVAVIAKDLAPIGDKILGVVDKATGKFSSGAGNGLQKVMDWLKKDGPKVEETVKQLASAFLNIGKALGGMSVGSIQIWLTIATVLATIARNPIGAGVLAGLLIFAKIAPLAMGLFKVGMAIKEIAVAEKTMAIASAILEVATGPIGIAIIAIGLIVLLVATHFQFFKRIALDAFHWVVNAGKTAFNWVKHNWPLVLAILVGPIGLAVWAIIKYWHDISHFAGVAVSDIGKFFKGAYHLILAAFNGAAMWLYNAGRDIVEGAIHGIENGFGKLAGVVGKLANMIPSGFKRLLGINSPSKVLSALAAGVPEGIVLGLESGASAVQAASNKLASIVKYAFLHRKIGSSEYSELNQFLAKDTDQLKFLADKRASILKTIAAAKSYAANVASNTAGGFSLSSIGSAITGQGGQITAGLIISGLHSGVAQIHRFTGDIEKLRKLHLGKDLLNQIIQMGPVDGAAYAEALIAGGTADIKQANSLETGITNGSAYLGKTAANLMFDSGKQAGKGFLSGLQAQVKSITALMTRIAQAMVATIRRELGIHSPSKVMADIGGFIADGLTLGINGSASKAVRASQSMVRAIANPSVSVRSLGAANSGNAPLEVEWIGGQADQEFMTWLKKNVRIRGGNPAVFGR